MRWDWYSDEAFDPRPFWFERHWYRPGEPLAERPPGSAVRYAFDDDGRPLVLEEFAGTELTATTTWRYDGDEAEATRVKADGTLVHTQHWHFEGDRLVSHESRAAGGTGREVYAYAEGLVVGIETWHDDQLFTSVAITYGAEGELLRIESASAQGRRPVEVLYRRPPAGETLESLGATVAGLLTEQIPLLVAEAEIEDAAACVTLSYAEGSCLPQISVGLDAERADGVEFWDLDWAVESELADAAALLDQELGLAGEGRRVPELLAVVAERLTVVDWSTILPITDDFEIYPVDESEEFSDPAAEPAAQPAS